MPMINEFNSNWKFCRGEVFGGADRERDSANWETVTLPHTWNADDMFPGRLEMESYIGPAWYRKTFRVPESFKEGDRLFIYLEAVANRSKVWVDGNFVGGKDAGFLGYRIDITDALGEGPEHVIAVRADNSYATGQVPPARIDWERYGGMYRPAWLLQKGPAYFDFKSIRITVPTLTDDEASVVVGSRVCNTGSPKRGVRVVHTLRDADGKFVVESATDLLAVPGRTTAHCVTLPTVNSPTRWTLDEPYLYELESVLYEGDTVLDREVNPVGFRTVEWDSQKGFFLNGVSTKLCGVNMHQDFPGLGNACPDRFHETEIAMVKEVGMNFVRTSHYPRNERILDLCDRHGILVLEEQPFWHGALREEHGPGFVGYVREQMRDMVEQHGNHPSIIAWNTVNEIMLTPHMGEGHTKPEERKDRHKLPQREWPFVRTCLEAMNDELHKLDPDRATVMVIGGQWRLNEEAGLTECADIVAYNGGAFHCKVDDTPLIDVHKDAHPDRVCLLSEGILNFGEDHRRADWDNENLRWKVLADYWSMIYSRDWFCGGSMWVFAAYSAFGTHRNMGMVDMWRIPNEAYQFFRSQWSNELVAHICCHWSWDVAEGTTREVTVFHNGDSVELFLNGTSLGIREPDQESYPGLPHSPAVWEVPFSKGELRAVVHKGTATAEDVRRTEGTPARVEWLPDSTELTGDGQDIAFLTAQVVDEAGNRCYNARGEIKVQVSGPARRTGPELLDLRGGLARLAIRSTAGTGNVKVSGTLDGLPAAIVELQAT